MQYAVLSDIHGNRWALEAVLADMRARGIGQLINLGDSLYGPLDPAGTGKMLRALTLTAVSGNEDRLILEGLTSVQGNQDRFILNPSVPNAQHHTLQFVRSALAPEDLAWLAEQPQAVRQNGMLLFHGTPADDTTYLLMEVLENHFEVRPTVQILELLGDHTQSLVLCGHDHLPRCVTLPDGRMVVNPGSVGLPAYDDDAPFGHRVENGTPHARYAIVTEREDQWQAEFIVVAYDWEAASRAAEMNGRPDWAVWLRTGRTESLHA